MSVLNIHDEILMNEIQSMANNDDNIDEKKRGFIVYHEYFFFISSLIGIIQILVTNSFSSLIISLIKSRNFFMSASIISLFTKKKLKIK